MDVGTDNAFAKMPAALVEEFSPSLPPNFPASKIPTNICQKELLYLYKCTMIFGVAMKCGKEYEDFQFCKRERDVKLFNELKNWETTEFAKMKRESKEIYLEELDDKINKLKEEFEKIPFSNLYQNKLWRFSSDIEQLTWRTSYLRKAFPELEKKKLSD